MGDTRLRAQAPKCKGYFLKCTAAAVVANHYCYSDAYTARDTVSDHWCDSCGELAIPHWEQGDRPRRATVHYDRFEPLLLAHLGDELCIALDHAFQTLCGERDGKFDNAADNEAARMRRAA